MTIMIKLDVDSVLGAIEVSEELRLPPLPSSELVMHTTLSDARSQGALRTLAAAFREHRAPAS